jgi:hypothetical protein
MATREKGGATMTTSIYEPPVLARIGDFTDLTRRQGTWGYDDYDECWIMC